MSLEEKKYQVTARKWRPMEFASVVGQEHITQTLVNAIITGRLHHAYLFNGPRGVGKTTTARILAKALNCLEPTENKEPCNKCESCKQILEGRSMDVVEIDGASNNSVDDIRKLRENAKYPPVAGNYKLYIIDEVHMLSTSAFNALLKTLEEPPKHLMFVFATTEPHKVPATILSRCQRFDFKRMQINDITSRLRFIAANENITIDDDSLVVIARKADGSMRDSQSIFDQVVAFCGTAIDYQQVNSALSIIDQGFFFRVTDMILKKDTSLAFSIVQEIMVSGYDPQEFLIGLSEHFRNYLTVMTTGNSKLIEAAKSYVEMYESESNNFSKGDIIRALNKTLQAQQNIRFASQPRLRLELLLTELSVMDSTVQIEELINLVKNSNVGDNFSSSNNSEPIPENALSTTEAEKKKPNLTTVNSYTNSHANSHITNGAAGSSGDRKSDDRKSDDRKSDNSKVNNGLNLTTIKEQWEGFIKFIQEKPMLANQLQSQYPSELSGNTITFFVETDNEKILLMRNEQFLNMRLSEFYKANISMAFVIGKPPVELQSNASFTRGKSKYSDHPFLKTLSETLGATPL